MKFLKLGLVVLAMCVGMSGVRAQARVGEDPMEKMESKSFDTMQLQTKQDAQTLKGIYILEDALQTLEQEYFGKISIDEDSFLKVQKEDFAKWKTANEFIHKNLLDFFVKLSQAGLYTYPLSGTSDPLLEKGETIPLNPLKQVHFILRANDSSDIPAAESFGTSQNTFFINLNSSSLSTPDSLISELQGLDAWSETWVSYLATHPAFIIPPVEKDINDIWKIAPDKNTFWEEFPAKHKELLTDFATKMSKKSDAGGAAKNIAALRSSFVLAHKATRMFQHTQEFATDRAQKYAKLDPAVFGLEAFQARIKDVSADNPAAALTTLTEVLNDWTGYKKKLALFFELPPVSNGDILAGPPRGESGYKYVMERFIPKYVNGAISFLLGFGVLFLIIGGITYLISSGDQDLTKKAKDTILWSIVACILAALAWVFVNFVISIDFYG